MTFRCVESIRAKTPDCKRNNYKIVIVDNGSTEESFFQLEKVYGDSTDVILLRNADNLGFAKGNNVGIDYALKHYNPEFLVVENSDTEIITYDIFSILQKKYAQHHFSVLGPIILTKDGKCDINPQADCPRQKNDIEKSRRLFKKTISRYEHHTYWFFHLMNNCMFVLRKIFNLRSKGNSKTLDFRKEQTGVMLHGSFMVFSRAFFQKLSGFDPRTFLYMEEDILYWKMLHRGMISLFCPEIVVYHAEKSSTWNDVDSNKKKALFRYKNLLLSYDVYETVMEEEPN